VTALVWLAAVALVLVGLVGTVVPGLPGAILVLAGLALAAWVDGFQRVGWPTLVLLAALTAATYVLDLLATAIGARRFGASRWAVAGAVVGALVGLFFGLPGLLLGPFAGAFLAELLARRDVSQAGRAGVGAWLGFLVGTAGKLALVVAMLAVFWAAYLRRGG
jgi:hypothetical protein